MDNFKNSIDFFVLKYINNHSLKVGESMIKMYGKKKVKLEFIFNEDGDDLKRIIDRTFKEELYKKKILLGGVLDELSKKEEDGI